MGAAWPWTGRGAFSRGNNHTSALAPHAPSNMTPRIRIRQRDQGQSCRGFVEAHPRVRREHRGLGACTSASLIARYSPRKHKHPHPRQNKSNAKALQAQKEDQKAEALH